MKAAERQHLSSNVHELDRSQNRVLIMRSIRIHTQSSSWVPIAAYKVSLLALLVRSRLCAKRHNNMLSLQQSLPATYVAAASMRSTAKVPVTT